ncbi:MAG: carnitine 3-dehydrogenase [Proteobacteria bacterium]|nr:carnitine 3-dehydrogenase [Pseudomonadota bacterium]
MAEFSKVAVIGGGVIGGGWVARFLLNGLDVTLYDPDDTALSKVNRIIANAERAYDDLLDVDRPKIGVLNLTSDIREAVENSDFIQENVPENFELKKKILAEIDQHAPENTLICSSTSGLLPTELQADLKHPERFLVGHPFNPVYLLPLVEICGGDLTSEDKKNAAADFYRDIGMKPLILKKEIDAFIADRLLEAYWREALWLVKDGIATVEEIDDAIRYGAGLRWAMMGTFQVYRIAGGDAGMRHFLSQFGPSLKWPWTKLMDVPELDDGLIGRITEQSDEQAGDLSIQELEKIRDNGLVRILKSLQRIDWGAGETLSDYEAKLKSNAPKSQLDYSRPLLLHRTKIKSDWIDYNGHMTEHRYLQVFGETTDKLLDIIGMTDSYVKSGFSIYTLETHIRHLQEGKRGEEIYVTTHLLGLDSKRFRVLHVITREQDSSVLATAEQMLMSVNITENKACEFGEVLSENLTEIWDYHQKLPIPDFAGAGIKSLQTS